MNGLWILFAGFAILFSTPAVAGGSEITDHLTRIEAALRAAPTDHLAPEQRAERLRNLDRLRAYRERERYPHNHIAPDGLARQVPLDGGFEGSSPTQPIFVDEHGTHCAVGFLIAESGADDLVEEIVSRENDRYLLEMEGSAELSRWIASSGLTPTELARIQPGYAFSTVGCDAFEPPPIGQTRVTQMTECAGEPAIWVAATHHCAMDCDPERLQVWVDVGNMGQALASDFVVLAIGTDPTETVIEQWTVDELAPGEAVRFGPLEHPPSGSVRMELDPWGLDCGWGYTAITPGMYGMSMADVRVEKCGGCGCAWSDPRSLPLLGGLVVLLTLAKRRL